MSTQFLRNKLKDPWTKVCSFCFFSLSGFPQRRLLDLHTKDFEMKANGTRRTSEVSDDVLAFE